MALAVALHMAMPDSTREAETPSRRDPRAVGFLLALLGAVGAAAACGSDGDGANGRDPEQQVTGAAGGGGGYAIVGGGGDAGAPPGPSAGSGGVGGSGVGSTGGTGPYWGQGGDAGTGGAYMDVPCPSSFDDSEAPLQAIPSTERPSYAPALSGDGSTVTGMSFEAGMYGPVAGSSHAYRWSKQAGMTILDDEHQAAPAAINSDGTIIVGEASAADGSRGAARWSSGAAVLLPALEGATGGGATAVSADGSVIAGYQAFDYNEVPVRWTSAGVERLDQPFTVSAEGPNFPLTVRVRGLSADGTIAVGAENSRAAPSLRWVGLGPAERLSVTNAAQGNEVHAISADGSVLVGTALFDDPLRSLFVRWQGGPGGALEALSQNTFAEAHAVSGDGSLVGGYDVTSTDSAVLWDAAHGMRRLRDVLSAAGVDVSAWRFQDITGIANDGKVLVGEAQCGSRKQGFLVRLP